MVSVWNYGECMEVYAECMKVYGECMKVYESVL